jgi:hypothetical protein
VRGVRRGLGEDTLAATTLSNRLFRSENHALGNATGC